jgi:hypothetical protein
MLFPLRSGGTSRLQTDARGEINVQRDVTEQVWAAPIATLANRVMTVKTVSILGAVYRNSDGLGGVAQALKITIGGVDADVKAVNILVTGTDSLDQVLTENFLCTVNTTGIIQGASLFKTVNTITSPAQDGAGVTMKVGTALNDAIVLPVETIPAAGKSYYLGSTLGITLQPDVARALTITLGGVAGDINGGTTPIVISGTDLNGDALTQNFTVTEDTAETVQGTKAFKTVTRVAVGAQDGAGVTLTVGVNDLLGLNNKLAIDTVLYASIGGVKEAVGPTVTTSSTVLADNTAHLTSALNATAVKIAYIN